MPTYEVEQYMVATVTVRVEADNPAHAVLKVCSGEADTETADDHPTLLEIDENRGIHFDEDPDLIEAVCEIDGSLVHKEGFIRSIRGVVNVDC